MQAGLDVIAVKKEGSCVQVDDRNVRGYRSPSEDFNSDVTTQFARVNGNVLEATFKRPVDTSDDASLTGCTTFQVTRAYSTICQSYIRCVHT